MNEKLNQYLNGVFAPYKGVKSVAGKTKELKHMVNNNLSLMQLEGSDLQGIRIHDGKFNYTALKGMDFSREKQIKGGSRKKKIELVNSLNPEWKDLYEEIII